MVMRLAQSDIDELKMIYRKEYGRELTDEAAWEMGERLLRLFRILTTDTVTAPQNEEFRLRPV